MLGTSCTGIMHPVIYHRMYHGNSPFVRVNKGLAGVTPSMLALSHTPSSSRYRVFEDVLIARESRINF